jgi:hypothetical protein
MKQFSLQNYKPLTDAVDALSLLKEALYSSEIEMLLNEGVTLLKLVIFMRK